MNMKLQTVVTLPYIYHYLSTRKTFWEGKFTPDNFTVVNMKHFGCRNARKHREIKDSDRYITLVISLKFGSIDKMRITSSDTKDN